MKFSTIRNERTIRFEKWKLIAYPVISCFTVFSFPIVLFTLIPTINEIGFHAFSFSEDVLINYFMLPFTCIDMCILLGYAKLLKRFSGNICRFFQKCEKKEEKRK